MNKLKTTANGGFDFFLDDFRFEQAAVREAFYGLLSAWGVTNADSFIISGVVNSGGFVPGGTFTAGYVSFGGEIFKVEAGTLPSHVPGGSFMFAVDTSYDAAGNKVFEDSSSQQTYEVRKAKIISSPLSGSDMLYNASTPTLIGKTTVLCEPKANNPNQLITKVVDIGTWDMDTDAVKDVLHGVADYTKIVSVEAMVRSDGGFTTFGGHSFAVDRLPLNVCLPLYSAAPQGYIIGVGSTKVALERLAGGYFDDAAFNNTASGYNRGWIIIKYLP